MLGGATKDFIRQNACK